MLLFLYFFFGVNVMYDDDDAKKGEMTEECNSKNLLAGAQATRACMYFR